MKNFRPSGWTSSPKLPVEKLPLRHRRAWLNTGRASSGHVGDTGLPTLLPPSPVYRAHITWNHFTLALFYFSLFVFFIKTTESFATSNLSFLPHSYFFFLSPSFMYFPNTHLHTNKDYPTKPPMPLVSRFYFSVFWTARAKLWRTLICNIDEKKHVFFKMKFLVYHSMVLWSINIYTSVFPFVWKCVCMYVCMRVFECESPLVFIKYWMLV